MFGSTTLLPFTPITTNLAIGTLAPAGWQRINELPLVILVGVTGVGKSTLLAEFSKHLSSFLLLPDRRQLTDQLIISYYKCEQRGVGNDIRLQEEGMCMYSPILAHVVKSQVGVVDVYP